MRWKYSVRAKNPSKELVETLAEQAHISWSGWLRWMWKQSFGIFGYMIVPKIMVKRWTRQMNTRYADLTELEKNSDREEAMRIIASITENDQ